MVQGEHCGRSAGTGSDAQFRQNPCSAARSQTYRAMKQPDDLDQRLMRAAKSGSRVALGMLLSRHEPRMRSAVRGMLRNAEDVEDCLQETNMRVTTSLQTFRDHAPFGPWVRRIAVNVAISALRRTKGRAAVALPPELTAPGAGPASQLVLSQSAERVRLALAAVSGPHRRVLELRLIRGLSHSEIAEILRLPTSSARVLFVRAVQSLRRVVELEL